MKKYLVALLFAALAGTVQAQPWIERVKDICPGSCASIPYEMAVCYDKLYFTATVVGARGPWVSDGSSAGTIDISNFAPIYPYSVPREYTEWNGWVMFVAQPGNQAYLMKTDGTKVNTDYATSTAFTDLKGLTVFNSLVYFSARQTTNDHELWVSDGTNAGTMQVMDINPGVNGSYPADFTIMNGSLYFTANDGVNGRELWVTDGTGAGTHMVADIYTGFISSNPGDLIVWNNKLYFGCTSASGDGLWVSDGTAAGTQEIQSGILPKNMTVTGGKLYFSATVNGSAELYTSNGLTSGTYMIKDINPGGSYVDIPRPVGHDGKLYFIEADGTDGQHQFLWQTDGTTAGTVKVSGNFFNPRGLTSYAGKLCFAAQSAGGRDQVWVYDGTTTTEVVPVLTPTGIVKPDASIGSFFALKQSLYFTANYDSTDVELWKLTDFPLNIAQQETDKNKIYPNPATAVVHIELQEEGAAVVTIYSVLGQQVLQQQLDKKETAIDIRSLIPGVYTVQVQQGGAQHTERLVVR